MLLLRMLGPLMAMFLLCDADTICPAELNPLTLDPPEITGEYGESFLVNCTSSDEFHEGIYWKLGSTKYEMEDENSFLPWPVSLSDWDLTAECKIKLNDGFECSKDLKITIYKTPDVVSVSELDHDLIPEGTEYLLKCDIINVAPVQNLKVRWYRGNETIYTQMFNDTGVSPVNVSSTLRVLAERDANAALFRCEAELHLGPKGPKLIPTISSPFTAVVLYKPLIQACPDHYAGVEHEFNLDMLSCQASGNPPPDVHWYYQGKRINASEPLTRTQSGKYTAEVVNSIGSSNTSVDITIEYAPELKRYTDDVFVYVGNDVTLTCGAEGNPPPVFNWTCDGVNMLENTDNLTITGVITSATYICTATNDLGSISKQIRLRAMTTATTATPAAITTPEASAQTDDSGMRWENASRDTGFKTLPTVPWTITKLQELTRGPKCYLTLRDNQCFEMPNISLYKTPDVVSVSELDHDLMLEGTEYLLNCDIINVAPVQNLKVRWYRGNETIYTQMFNDTGVSPVNVSSTLRVLAERDDNGALFRCEAELHLGPKEPKLILTTSPPFTAVVLYEPLIQACPDHYAGVEHEFNLDMLSCQAGGNPPPDVHWYYQGKRINASEPLTRTQSGKYTAEVVNSIGSSNTSVDITIEYGPSFTCNDSYEFQEDDKLQTLCEPKGMPTPVIAWFKDGEKTATPNRWTRHDSGKYDLRAINKHGTASHTLHVNILYSPLFKMGNYTAEVAPGENMTFNCSAEGNPTPEIRWDYTSEVNVMETTRGGQKNISITGATSTNAGVYICVATNKVGNVTRAVTLMMKGKTSAVPWAVIWALLILFIIIIIILILISFHRKRWKKHGQYSFVPDEGNDGSDRSIPLTVTSDGVGYD